MTKTFTVDKVESNGTILLISVKVETYLGVKNDEFGAEIPMIETESFNTQVAIANIPTTTKKEYVLGVLKDAYLAQKAEQAKWKAFEGYTITI